MLYKKYHRSYVSQFKKGVKFNILSVEAVLYEPWYDNVNKAVCISGSRYGYWTLVYSDGKIDKYRHAI